MRAIDRYSNRSGYVKKAGKPAKSHGPSLTPALDRKFRSSKKNPNRFVEKSRFSIDRPDEVRGIPYEAVKQRKSQAFLSKGISNRVSRSPVRTANIKRGNTKWL